MSDLQDRIAGLSPEKREVLQRLLRREGVDVTPPAIRPRPRTAAGLPLSFAQRRLWFLDQMEPGSSFYNVVDSIAFDEPVDPQIVARSLNEIVRRHEVLRTTFERHSPEPVQVVAPKLDLALDVKDFRALPAAERNAVADRFSTAFADRPFDLCRGPLLRAALVMTDEDVCELLLSMHHIISDAWSLDLFERELRALYLAFSRGRPSPLAPLPIQYADFALWQRDWLSGDVLDSQLAYWTRTLTGAPRVLDLPLARARPPVPTYRGAAQSRLVPARVVLALHALAQREGATLFMTTLAAFNVLLGRYTDQQDLLLGTPVAGRNRAETEPLIGFFVNTVVIRTDLSGDPTFRALLRRTRDVCLGAFAHQELPFEMLVEALQPDRDLSRNPLFQVTFQCSGVPNLVDDDPGPEPAESQEVDVAPDVHPGTAKFDLAVNVWDGGRSLRLQADYSTDLFDDASMTRLLQHFEHVLQRVAEQPDAPVSSVSLLSEAERRRAVEEWNRTTTSYPRESSLGDLFDRQVAAVPSAIAVTCGDEGLTYAELNRRADALSRQLRALGVGPEILVGLFMERSTELIVGMLGIVKAGGAYVPLDPEYPAQRLSFMVSDADFGVLVTDARHEASLPDVTCPVVVVGAGDQSVAGESLAPVRAVSPDNPAYVIYTSGSTGTPKGIVVTHRGVARTICGTNYLDVGILDRVAQASTTSFDAATFEIWGALLNGATLEILPRAVLLVPEHLDEQLRQLRINILFVTTAVLNQVAARAPRAFARLRCLLFGGEAADPGSVRLILERGAPQRLLHLYGPTESTTFATWHPVEAVPDDAVTIPIGRAVSNTAIYILDERLQPVPVGVVGELCIGGDGLARGYLHDASRTVERFAPSPFGAAPGQRLYRSGDLAKHLPGGAIEFVGRRDGQVKIRGHRIELGEVEALLRAHPEVDDVVALSRADTRGDKRLIAYVAARPGREVGVADLRAHMAQRAPGYMMPALFVVLAALPLTPNGKIDRAALPALEHVQSGQAPHITRCRTPTEETISRIFASILQVSAVGADDNFFELGGHSLLVTQVVSRVRELCQVEVPLRAIFTGPTVAALASVVDELLTRGTDAPEAAIVPVARDVYRVGRSSSGQLAIPEALKPLLHLSSTR
jgi:amino acid adenylation domain-containing protein